MHNHLHKCAKSDFDDERPIENSSNKKMPKSKLHSLSNVQVSVCVCALHVCFVVACQINVPKKHGKWQLMNSPHKKCKMKWKEKWMLFIALHTHTHTQTTIYYCTEYTKGNLTQTDYESHRKRSIIRFVQHLKKYAFDMTNWFAVLKLALLNFILILVILSCCCISA